MKVIYKTQKRKKKRSKRLTCLDCFHSSLYDANFEYKAPRGRVYCQKYQTVVQIGCARSCPEFEEYRDRGAAMLIENVGRTKRTSKVDEKTPEFEEKT